MPKFLISDSYSFYNKGDAAIVGGMLKTIRNFYPDSEISILSFTPNEDSEYNSRYGAKTYSRLFNISDISKRPLISALILLPKMLLYLIWAKFDFIPIWREDKFILNLYRNADLVITCGGGYLGGNKLVTTVVTLFPIYLAKKFGKKIYVYAQSVEPFTSKILKIFTKLILNKVDLITAREEYSMNVIKSLHLSCASCLTADPAFLIDQESVEVANELLRKKGIIMNEKLRIGMTVRDWYFPTDKEPTKKMIQYIDTMVISVEKILEERNAIIVFFPQVIFSPYDDDRIISNLIGDRIKKPLRERLFVLTENYLPEEIKAMIGTMDVFVGTRMHSNIFAISMNVPTLAIAYEQKTYGIMKMLELGDYVLDISNITPELLINSINQLLGEREIVIQKIKQKLPHVQEEAIRNGELIKDVLRVNGQLQNGKR